MQLSRSRIAIGLAACVVAAAFLSCGTIPYRVAENDPNAGVRKIPGAYSRITFSEKINSQSDNPGERTRFIGIAASGGGSRAAVFTSAVLSELDRIGFLKHIDAISTVSGAGLPGAYFAINSKKLIGNEEEWERMHDLMAQDFRSAWIYELVKPWNIALTTFTTMDRSDLMTDTLDRKLFHGATFAQLRKAKAPGEPMWFANATDTTDGGRRFVFEDTTFERLLGSDLGSMRIARAVQTSAAFPGVFNSTTLRQYDREGVATGRYRHLIDGGASDNLGVDTLLDLADSYAKHYYAYKQAPPGTTPFACLLILVDAFLPIDATRTRRENDGRHDRTSHFIDLNFVDAFDALLAHRRREQLDVLGFAAHQPALPDLSERDASSRITWARSARETFIDPPSAAREYGYPRVRHVPIRPQDVVSNQEGL